MPSGLRRKPGMSTSSPHQSGLTLIELIVFIVVVSIGVVGILSVMNVTVQHSADPMVRKQALALADSIMEEIVLKAYSDPDGASGETARDLFDDVEDYNGKNNAVFSDLPNELSAYLIGIGITADTLGGIAAKKVTVTVTHGAETISLTGYRTSY